MLSRLSLVRAAGLRPSTARRDLPKPCSGTVWWAREELNLRPLPCQQNTGNRCAKRRLCRSPPTVEVEGKRSLDVKGNALFDHPPGPVAREALASSFGHWGVNGLNSDLERSARPKLPCPVRSGTGWGRWGGWPQEPPRRAASVRRSERGAKSRAGPPRRVAHKVAVGVNGLSPLRSRFHVCGPCCDRSPC